MANATPATPSCGFTAVVAHRGDKVVLSTADGRIVTERTAGENDARLIQQGAEICRQGGRPGGELRIMAGQYDLKESIVLDFPCTVSGEGRGTILVPPPNDYAIRIMKTERSPSINDWVWGPERASIPRWLTDLCGERLYGVYVRSLAIVGNGRGKGIYLTGVTECICDDLAIHSTYDGAAIYIDRTVMESEFRSIVCYVNGSIKNREATIVVASQDDGDGNNNIQFTRVHVLLPNYIGVQIGTDKKFPPRLLYFTQSFFHGWLPAERMPPCDLFLVHAADPERGIVISESRFTNVGKANAMLHVEKGAVDLTNSILGGGYGKTIILADPDTKVSVRGNMFHEVQDGEWSLDASGADVIFAQNILGPQGRIQLQNARSAVVTGNRFGRSEKEAIVGVPKWLFRAKRRIQVSGNVFAPATH
ncbi:MAG: hypothetical protein M1457_04930 [bacterium]|nr:hypothetical protein [bacterium]